MDLVFDVGNTNTVIGLFAGDGELLEHWRAATDQLRTGDEWRVLLDNFLSQAQHSQAQDHQDTLSLRAVDRVVIGSVVPSVTGTLQRMCARLRLESLTVSNSTDTGMQLNVDEPRELGPDCIANGVSAIAEGSLPAIIVDMGTATTLDVVGRDGSYEGIIILPGAAVSLDALVSRAARLRSVSVEVPKSLIGKRTVSAVQSGATFGVASQIDGLCERIKEEMGADACVYFTGGLSSVIAPISRQCNVHDPWMTLRGFALIAQRQRNLPESNA